RSSDLHPRAAAGVRGRRVRAARGPRRQHHRPRAGRPCGAGAGAGGGAASVGAPAPVHPEGGVRVSGPTVIVICAGEATRWGGHRGTPKHLLAPEGERLLDRTVRLAREHGAGRVLVVSKPGDARYEADGAERVDARLTPSNADADKFLSSRHLWAPDGRTVVLYGDVWFDDEAMALILGDERRQWLLWCRPGASQTTGATSGECFAVTFWPEHHAEYEQ